MPKVINVPFVDLGAQYLEIRDDLLNRIDEIGKSGQYILGEECRQFELELSEFCGSSFAISVANGSDALFLVLKALGIGPGDEVITAPNSFLASAWVIVATGATPKYCDVDSYYNLDPLSFQQAITSRTKAVIPVHLAGVPCDIEKIVDIANKSNIHVIEDCAQAIGATFNGRHVGNFGIAGGFSLHPLKNLGVMGDGGFITTNNENLAQKLLLLRNHGLKNRDEMLIWGYNSRRDEVQAAVGRLKLQLLKKWNERVAEIAHIYKEAFSGRIDLLSFPTQSKPVWHNFLLFSKKRNQMREYLLKNGIDTRIHYPIPIHLQIGHNNEFNVGDFPKAEYQSTHSLSLPIYPTMNNEQVQHVVNHVLEFCKTNLT